MLTTNFTYIIKEISMHDFRRTPVEHAAAEHIPLYKNAAYRTAYDKARGAGLSVVAAYRAGCEARKRTRRHRLAVHWNDPKFKQRHAWCTRARKAHWAHVDRGEPVTQVEQAYLDWYAHYKVAKKMKDVAAREARFEELRKWLLDQPGVYF